MKKKKSNIVDCDACSAECCKYVAIEIDRPTDQNDYDNIRWYLMHENICVFIDHDDDWYIEFKTLCTHLDKDNKCGVYEKRPAICAKHGVDDGVCEFLGEEAPYKVCFENETEFEKYMKNNN